MAKGKSPKGSVRTFLICMILMLPLFVLAVPAGSSAMVTADVVAMDQVITYNRMGAFAPAGMIFALKRDVFPKGTPAVDQILENSCASVTCLPGQVQLRDDKRPRPLTLRVNEGESIAITLTNLLTIGPNLTDAQNEAPGIQLCENVDGDPRPGICQSEQPATRNVSIHVHGMVPVSISDDGSNVGNNASSLVAPGNSHTYTLNALKEGAYVITSGPNLGGEGHSGPVASGLFGTLNVEPPGTVWYRSQVTREEMLAAINTSFDLLLGACADDATLDPAPGYTCDGQPVLNYDATYASGPYTGLPILKILNDSNETVHNELNAIIHGVSDDPDSYQLYPNRGESFREFTIVFHDEVKMVQAFPEWYKQLAFTLGSVKDGFAVNYGTGGIGSEIIGNRLGVGPMHECVECKYEEFFLTSWVVGDPAMIVDVPASAGLENCDPALNNCIDVGPKATKAFYPDDPSNVHHSYLNDRTKFRNVHVGTEHHIFHLHAHQWNFVSDDNEEDQSNYLDAQALGPGSSFTYEITYGGAGNRNKTAGDSIMHCHFYPHFAQGMWELWRVHDVFEIGSLLDVDGRVLERGLPDSEICADGAGGSLCGGYDAAGNPIPGGTPIPGVVPIPAKAMPPMPGHFVAKVDDDNDPATADVDVPFMGYPFYIPGVIGHRPPTPPMDLMADGGLPRHIITGGQKDPAKTFQTATNFDAVLLEIDAFELPENGTSVEKGAMAFHGPQASGVYHNSYLPDGGYAGFEVNGLPPIAGAPYADPCRSDDYDGGSKGLPVGNSRYYAASVIELDTTLNKVGWHFNQQRILVLDGDVQATLDGTRAPEPFVMRANSRDCVDYDHTNRVPNVYQLDDYQVRTPTDVIGQHIHLVKFDVTSSDGSANGWNYEDGTLSKDEVTERLHALKHVGGSWSGLNGETAADLPADATGFRTTRQRWYVDPGWSGNAFTHDHYGPSTHQQAGLYATLLVEPEGSTWRDPATGVAMGGRFDGGPTSWRADIINDDDAYREFYLEFGDFQLAYRSDVGDGAGFLNGPQTAVNPSYRNEPGLPDILLPKVDPLVNPTTAVIPGCGPGNGGGWTGCAPEAISAADPGTMVVNYRNEPLALRVRDPLSNSQAPGLAGDLSYAFQSRTDRADARLNGDPASWPYGAQTATEGALAGDPFTPMLRVYEGDKVSLRVQVGAHEEGHNFSMNGIRWLQNWKSGVSGFRNSQMAGISEYFFFNVPGMAAVKNPIGFEDYMYQTGSSVDARWNGTWGIMRAYDGLVDGLQPLPNNLDGKTPPVGGQGGRPPFAGVCPRDAPERKYDVVAVRAADVLPGGAIQYNPDFIDPTGMLYVMKSDLDAQGKLKAERRVEPLILRAAAGECVFITLTNQLAGPPLDADGFNTLPMIVNQFGGNQILPSASVGLHAQLVEYDMFDSDGMNVGFNPVQTAAPGGSTTYKWYAGKVEITPGTPGNRTATPIEYGAINLMASDPIEGSSKGLIGALIIEPQGATWADGSVTGKGKNKITKPDGEPVTQDFDPNEIGKLSRAAIDINDANGNFLFRDFVVIQQDDINMQFANAKFGFATGDPVPTVSEEEEAEDSGMKGINYRTDPIWNRLNIGPTTVNTRAVDYTDAFAGDSVTPIFTAGPTQAIRFRVLKPGGHNRNNVFTLHGHIWARYPYGPGSTVIDPFNLNTFWHGEQMGHGPTNHINVVPINNRPPGDYLYRDMAPVHVDNGEWGILRVE